MWYYIYFKNHDVLYFWSEFNAIHSGEEERICNNRYTDMTFSVVVSVPIYSDLCVRVYFDMRTKETYIIVLDIVLFLTAIRSGMA